MEKQTTQEHSHFHIHKSEKGECSIICNPIRELNGLIETVDRIIYSTDMPYQQRKEKFRTLYQRTMFGLFLENFNVFRRLYDGALSYSPDLQLFFECVKNYPYPFWDYPPNSNFFSEHANQFVDVMRKEGEKINIKKLVADWKKGPLKNQARLKTYLDRLFDKYARITVIRIDLHLRNGSNSESPSPEMLCSLIETEQVRSMISFYSGNEPPKANPSLERITLDKIKSEYKRWSDNARNKKSLFRDMVGHVIRYEFSKGAGYHIHAALFFDGSKRQNDEWLGQSIGEYWTKTTNGQGYFFNCNRKKYRDSGVALLHKSGIQVARG